jgi:DHA1 family multidrug resistance protein-like MFS transporter
MAPVWARLADRFGRKVMVARSLASFVVIMSLMAFVSAPWQVFALRAIQGLFAGYGTIAMTMAAESAPPEHTATAIGWVQTAQRLGPALGPVIGGVLAQAFGLRQTFLVSAAVYFAGFLIVVVGYREVVKSGPAPAVAAPETTFRDLRRVRHFALFLATVFGLQLVDRSFGPILPLYLLEVGTGADQVPFLSGVIFTTTAGSAALGNQACAWLLKRWDAAWLIPASAGLAALAAAVFGMTAPLEGLLVTAIILGLGIGVATTATYTAATHAVPAVTRGIAFGYLSTAYLTGLAASPVIAGFVGSLSMRAVFFADAAGLAVLAWIVRSKMAAPARAAVSAG